MQAPDKKEQIIQTHASLVIAVVQTIHNAELRPHLDTILQQSAPTTLPKADQQSGDATLAAPMFAQLIDEARRGNHNSLSILGSMAEQMSNAGGDLSNLSAVIKDMIDGERDIDKLCTRMGPQGESLVTQIISELAKLDTH